MSRHDEIDVEAFKRLQQGDYVKLHNWTIDALGDLMQAVYLSKLMYWSKYPDDEDGSFTRTVATIERVLGMSRRQQDTARKELQEMGLIEVRRRGVPAQLRYRIIWENVARLAAQTPVRPDGFERDSYTPDAQSRVYESANVRVDQSRVYENAKLDRTEEPDRIVLSSHSLTYNNEPKGTEINPDPQRIKPNRVPTTLPQLQALDPVGDRDLILRSRIRPVTPWGARTLEAQTAWQLLQEEWDRRHKR